MKYTLILGLLLATSAQSKDIFNTSALGSINTACKVKEIRKITGGAISYFFEGEKMQFSTCDKNKKIITVAECFKNKKDFDYKLKKLGLSEGNKKITINGKTVLAGGAQNCIVFNEYGLEAQLDEILNSDNK
jgi:hypothetical protein